MWTLAARASGQRPRRPKRRNRRLSSLVLVVRVGAGEIGQIADAGPEDLELAHTGRQDQFIHQQRGVARQVGEDADR